MINHILHVLRDVSLSKNNGKFLADKSYAFDTVFFMAKFIIHNQQNLRFNKKQLRKDAIAYVEDIFQLKKGTAGAVNYYLETLNILEFANVIVKETTDQYRIIDLEILKFISAYPENSYIFLYLIVWQTFKNDGLSELFSNYCNAGIDEKELYIRKIYNIFCARSSSIETDNTQWSKQLVKYALIVLGFINKQPKVSRELKVKNETLSIEDISLNVAGTKTPLELPKKNDYLFHFNFTYVQNTLADFLFIHFTRVGIITVPVNSIAQDLADLKLSLLDHKTQQMPEEEKEQYIKNIVRTRNQNIQRQFRKNLFDNNEHKCPLCGYCFEDFLIASHIKPYAKCDNTYDAINHFNGLLLCPNHDKLFEGANYMTIQYATGKIILSSKALQSVDYKCLEGKYLPKVYIQNERRHYLQWHNQNFAKNNEDKKHLV